MDTPILIALLAGLSVIALALIGAGRTRRKDRQDHGDGGAGHGGGEAGGGDCGSDGGGGD